MTITQLYREHLKINDGPFKQTLALSSACYFSLKLIEYFPRETNFQIHYFGKALSLASAIGILHFSGLLYEKSLINRVGFNLFNFGPFQCSASLKKILRTIRTLFDSYA